MNIDLKNRIIADFLLEFYCIIDQIKENLYEIESSDHRHDASLHLGRFSLLPHSPLHERLVRVAVFIIT
jgi:hypothetical protein